MRGRRVRGRTAERTSVASGRMRRDDRNASRERRRDAMVPRDVRAVPPSRLLSRQNVSSRVGARRAVRLEAHRCSSDLTRRISRTAVPLVSQVRHHVIGRPAHRMAARDQLWNDRTSMQPTHCRLRRLGTDVDDGRSGRLGSVHAHRARRPKRNSAKTLAGRLYARAREHSHCMGAIQPISLRQLDQFSRDLEDARPCSQDAITTSIRAYGVRTKRADGHEE